jgi:dTDP-4-amino-4,6-dideoxygalactose transaminase
MIQLTDLWAEHQPLMPAFLQAVQDSVRTSQFIGGDAVRSFEQNFSDYLGGAHVISCANGTDALQAAYMALGLGAGDEVIVPNFNYIAAAEAAAVLGIVPVLCDICPHTFNIAADHIAAAVTPRTRAVVVVHLFGQCADMQPIIHFCALHNLHIIEDAAQSTGATYTLNNKKTAHAGTMGAVGTTSFFPTKNLGGLGDGGAIFTQHHHLAAPLKAICNHGQIQKYQHQTIGINSRLDTIQAAFLNIKLQHLTQSIKKRQQAAAYYDQHLQNIVQIPQRQPHANHTYNQYTILTPDRTPLKIFLAEKHIATMIYYPEILSAQHALYQKCVPMPTPNAQKVTQQCLSLPISANITTEQQQYICQQIQAFFC